MPKQKRLSAAGVYVSAGGPTLGIQKNFEIVAHYTDGLFGKSTREHNWPRVYEDTDPGEWETDSSIDFMYCAPPCAAFSSLGGRGIDWESNPKIQKAYQALELGLESKPKIWMMESVTGFYRRGRSFIEMAEERWMEAGYQITHFITGGILHGVPQRRIRWHMFASRVEMQFPKDRGKQVLTMRDAFKVYGPPKQGLGQAPTNDKIKKLQRYAPDGCKYRDVFTHLVGIHDSEVGLYSGVPHYSLRRGEWDRSVPTLVGTPRVYMPKPETRLYSVGEGLVMCGYPKSFDIVGRNVRDSYDQIAKGILPPLAEYLGKVARLSLEENVRIRKPKEPRVVDWSGDARALARQVDPPIPKMHMKYWGVYNNWLVRKRDE